MSDQEAVRILAVVGSLRDDSCNLLLIEQAIKLAPDGAEMVLFEGLGEIPPFDEDAEHPEPAAVARWREAIRGADAVLVATPEYNASIPGQLKNAFDWASRANPGGEGLAGSAMYGRPVAVISASKGQFGAVWAAQELRKALRAQGARVVETAELAVGNSAEAFDEHGQLRSSNQRERLGQLIEGLIEQAHALRRAGIDLRAGREPSTKRQ